MPGSIQSIERAAAVLHFLGAAGQPVPLGEVARVLALPKPTVHGIVRTLVDVGFVVQSVDTGHYALGEGLARLGETLDPHLLRARSANWADGLAARTGLEVQLGVPSGRHVEVLHHVFRPDGSPQRLRVGERQPLHSTALGLVLLAFAPAAARFVDAPPSPAAGQVDQVGQAGQAGQVGVTRAVQQTFRRGWAVADGTLTPGVAAVAAPVRHHAGVGVGALAVVGPQERVLAVGGAPAPRLVEQVVDAAAAISAHLEDRM